MFTKVLFASPNVHKNEYISDRNNFFKFENSGLLNKFCKAFSGFTSKKYISRITSFEGFMFIQGESKVTI